MTSTFDNSSCPALEDSSRSCFYTP
jgi:hypothetical protein